MKKAYRKINMLGKALALVLISGLALTSCQNNDNDLYQDDPIVRLAKAKQQMKDHLVNESAEGWIVTFRPDGGKQLGEFNVWFDFKEDWKVDVKTDFDVNNLGVESSDFNFTMLRTFALSFPYGNKIHEFTQGSFINKAGEEEMYSNRSDIEFLFKDYLANGDVLTTGYLSGQDVVFRKATQEDKKFRFDAKWQIYDQLEEMKQVTLMQDGVSKRLNFLANERHRSAYIGKISGNSISEMLTETGIVTFGVNDAGEVELVPALELENGKTIDKLVLIGNTFYGEADSENTILIRK